MQGTSLKSSQSAFSTCNRWNNSVTPTVSAASPPFAYSATRRSMEARGARDDADSPFTAIGDEFVRFYTPCEDGALIELNAGKSGRSTPGDNASIVSTDGDSQSTASGGNRPLVYARFLNQVPHSTPSGDASTDDDSQSRWGDDERSYSYKRYQPNAEGGTGSPTASTKGPPTVATPSRGSPRSIVDLAVTPTSVTADLPGSSRDGALSPALGFKGLQRESVFVRTLRRLNLDILVPSAQWGKVAQNVGAACYTAVVVGAAGAVVGGLVVAGCVAGAGPIAVGAVLAILIGYCLVSTITSLVRPLST